MPVFQGPSINAAILKRLFTLAVWEVIFELTDIDWAVCIDKCTLTLFDTVFPLTFIRSSVLPPAGSLKIHLSILPFSFIGPSTLLALKYTVTRLEAVYKLALIDITIGPLSCSDTIRKSVDKITNINFALSKKKLALTFHFAFYPSSSVLLILVFLFIIKWPSLEALAMRHSFLKLSFVRRTIRESKSSETTRLLFLSFLFRLGSSLYGSFHFLTSWRLKLLLFNRLGFLIAFRLFFFYRRKCLGWLCKARLYLPISALWLARCLTLYVMVTVRLRLHLHQLLSLCHLYRIPLLSRLYTAFRCEVLVEIY